MSREVQDRLLAEFGENIVSACCKGRGEELIKDFYQRQAEAFADTVFLKMSATLDAALNAPGDMDVEALTAHLDELPYTCGLMLLEAVASTCVQFNMPAEHQAAAETITSNSFAARLQQRLDAASRGGSA